MKAVFFDIDGTLVEQFTAGLYLSFLVENNVFRKQNLNNFSEATEAYKSGIKTYEQLAQVWGKELGEGLQGHSQGDVYSVTRKFWKLVESRIAPWAKEVIEMFTSKGYTTIAISGSPIELLHLYQEKLGLEQVFGSTAEITEGMYTGNVSLNLVLKTEKEMIVKEIIKNEHITFKDSFGFGDNEQDRAFLDMVGHPMVILSESNFRHYALKKGWPVFAFTDDISKHLKIHLRSV